MGLYCASCNHREGSFNNRERSLFRLCRKFPFPTLKSSLKLTVWRGSPSRWSVELGQCSTCGGVAVAPEQAVLTLAVRVGRDARDVTLTISDKEGASLGSDEGWIFCSGAGFRKRAATNANICSFILNEHYNDREMISFLQKV